MTLKTGWTTFTDQLHANPSLWAAVIVIGIIIAIMLISGIAIGYMWIKWSWVKRGNSQNMTGGDLTRKVLDKGEMSDVEIKSSWWLIKYWNMNKRRKTYRLRPWTHNRRSVWTMMEAAQQAWVSTLRNKNKKQFWLVFRLPFIIKGISIVAGIASAALAYYLIQKSGGTWATLNNGSNNALRGLFWLDVSIGFSVLTILYMIAEVGKIYLIRKNVTEYIKDTGLTNQELKTIYLIYTWRMVYAVAQALWELVKLILKVASRVNGDNSGSKN